MSKDESTLEILTDFLNALEAATVNAKRQIAGLVKVTPLEKALGHDAGQTAFVPAKKGSPKLPFDAEKIQWINRENENGKFQMTEDYSNLDYKALLAFLNEHIPAKCINSEGFFYWVYGNGTTIGRKPRK